jgi:6-phosphogluconolactonase (cycloisomerase 2 family)
LVLGVACADSANWHLTFVEIQRDGVDGVDGLGGAVSVAISPDGRHLYVAGRADDAVAVFSRDPSAGALTFVEVHEDGAEGVDGLDDAFSVAIAPDGRHVYVAGRADDAMAVFSREPATGSLTFLEVHKDGAGGLDGLDDAMSLTVSPDGKNLYAAGRADDAVAVFSRDLETGMLTFVEVQRDGAGGVDGLHGAVSLAISPDGKHLYVAGQLDDAVAVFGRDPNSGALAFVEVHKYGVGGVDGLNDATSLTVSPDGKNLYATGGGDSVRSPNESQLGSASLERPNAVAVFRRDPTSGALTFLEVQKDGVGGVDGLFLVKSVAISPGEKNLYAAGGGDDAVAVFSRDPTTGALAFVEKRQDGVKGVDGLDGAISLTISPDEKHVYAVGTRDNAVAVFSVAYPEAAAPRDSE